MSSPNWVQDVIAGIDNRAPPYRLQNVLPYVVKTHSVFGRYLIQVTPRVEHVSPVVVLVDLEQEENGNVEDVFRAPASAIPGSDGITFRRKNGRKYGTSTLADGTPVYLWHTEDEATPSQSYWIDCKALPPRIWFGNEHRGFLLIPIS
jgi:hypothetical protein